MEKTFLTAEWRKLAMANYTVDKEVLLPYLPAKTELDAWNNRHYVSLIGFRFQHVKLKGISIPGHTQFEEVNLRFYVRYKSSEGWRRGVVFISEIVPLRAISFVANTLYGEKYRTLPMSYTWSDTENELGVSYRWKKRTWNELQVVAGSKAYEVIPGTEEAFITEHYWGYAAQKNGRTKEYSVAHPRWAVYPTKQYGIEVDFKDLYGDRFAFLAAEKPVSVFIAEGSPIRINAGTIL